MSKYSRVIYGIIWHICIPTRPCDWQQTGRQEPAELANVQLIMKNKLREEVSGGRPPAAAAAHAAVQQSESHVCPAGRQADVWHGVITRLSFECETF